MKDERSLSVDDEENTTHAEKESDKDSD